MAPNDTPPAITLEPEPALEARGAILTGLRAYNHAHAGPTQYETFALAARDAEGKIVGGVAAEIAWNWLYVQRLWVADGQRHSGIGSRLLGEAERYARERGCTRVHLDTYDFQARPFYERLGYICYAQLDDFPPGHTRFALKKMLSD